MAVFVQRIRRVDFQKYGAVFALIVLFALSAILSPYFLQYQNLVNILRQVSYTGIIALGMTFIIIAGGIDLSVGSMVAIVGAILVVAINWLLPVFQSELLVILAVAALALILGFAGGAMNGVMVTKGRIAPFIVTLGTMAIFRSLTLYFGNAGEFRSKSEMFGNLGMGSYLYMPIPVWVMLVLAVLMNAALNNTRYGRYICAVGSNSRVAMFSAISVDRVRFFTYVITGVVVGVSSFLLTARFNAVSSTNVGMGFELDAIAAVIVGGTTLSGGRGTIWGTIIGAVILGIINNMLNMIGISPYLQGTVKGLVIIGAVYIQRQRA
ncbi:MAG: ABC transporter permease [Spirochaetia bacterium]|jgi:ribose transport system permease protein